MKLNPKAFKNCSICNWIIKSIQFDRFISIVQKVNELLHPDVLILTAPVKHSRKNWKWRNISIMQQSTGISGYLLLLSIQFVFIVIFAIYTDYDTDLQPKIGAQSEEGFIIPKYGRKNRSRTWKRFNVPLCPFSRFYVMDQQISKIFT